MGNAVYDIITEKITNALESGTIPWRQTWTSAATMPRNAATARPYRGVNTLLLTLTGHNSPLWATMRQINQMSGRIRKGERSTLVVFWKMRKVEHVDGDGDTHTETVPMLRYYRVWNLDQTEGVTLPARTRQVMSAQVEQTAPVAAAEEVIAGYAGGPKVHHGAVGAYYVPSTDEIHMPARDAFDSVDSYYATLFHELAHSTGHPQRLGRFETSPGVFGSHGYGREELVAEMAAAFLCGQTGIAPATVDNQAAYISSWLRTIREDVRAVVVAAGAAQRAADHILGREVDPD